MCLGSYEIRKVNANEATNPLLFLNIHSTLVVKRDELLLPKPFDTDEALKRSLHFGYRNLIEDAPLQANGVFIASSKVKTVLHRMQASDCSGPLQRSVAS